MNKQRTVTVLIALLISVNLFAQKHPVEPVRKVSGNTLTSETWPPGKVTVDSAFRHIGAERFILYGVAEVEIHLFVDADADKRVKRLYWVQYEGYLPSNKHTYDYDSPRKVNVSGTEFILDVYVTATGDQSKRPDSDGEHVLNLIRKAGYTVAPEQARARMVYLDAALRNELMVIYAESLSVSKTKAAEVLSEGKTNEKWKALEPAFLERATAGIKLEK